MNRAITAGFTGHREISEAATSVDARITDVIGALIGQGYQFFCAGGARGFDMLAAQSVLRQRETYPHVRLILILPFPNQYRRESGWTEEDIAEYQLLKVAADQVIYLQESHTRGCYHKRNRRLVDTSSVCVAYQRSQKGGTAYTVKYAAKEGLKIIHCAG